MTVSKTAGLAGALLLLAGAAQAQVADSNPSHVRAGAYKIEPGHTRVLFSLSHMGFSTWYGDFSGVSGALTLDPAQPTAAQLEVTVPIASIATTNAKLDEELKSADWFNAASFPTAHFVSRKVTPTGAGQADVDGDLTLHGVTRPETLHVTFNGAGVNPLDKAYTVGFEARGVIHRSEFGVTKYVPLLSDDVELILSGAFEAAK